MEAQSLSSLVESALNGRTPGAAPETDAALTQTVNRLDSLYWKEADRIALAVEKESADRLIFSKEQRLLLDAGLLDERLTILSSPGAEAPPATFRAALLRELYAKEPTALYFSQWIAERYRWFILYGKLEEKKKEGEERSETRVIRVERSKIYTSLRPLFTNLPGFTERMVAIFFSGQLDSAIEALSSHISSREDTLAADQRNKLIETRRRLIERARERAKTEEELTLFDEVEKIDARLRTNRSEAVQPTVSEQLGRASPKERSDFLAGELKLVRSLLRLGTTGSGLTRTHSVLLSFHQRLTKPDVALIAESVREMDPNLPSLPSVLIAPYIGTGFYEWDRDTLFLPMIPTRSPQEAAVNAVANYRVMLDTLQEEGRLRKAYEMKFGKGDFRNNFVRDYRDWVVGIGAGFKGAMSPPSYDFFRDHIGPSPTHLFARREMHNLTPVERRNVVMECRGKLNRAEGGFDEHYKLAIVYWKEARIQEAMEQMAMCARIDPTDGRTLLGLAHIYATLGVNDKARRTYGECAEMAPNSIWHIYAVEALNKL
ncbi:MAG: hypothetical protein A2Z34_06170 [Planctomycetes bacterium RBG_16_59_8]|nr:MAG: hypothetical protein A2Z34_06170 [Planctomycetes bacterium RBG_16_59_8]